MNKKEFEEKFVITLKAFGLVDGEHDYVYSQSNELWQWIEQYAKEARVNENEYWRTKLNSFQRSSKGIERQEFFNRIKELKDD